MNDYNLDQYNFEKIGMELKRLRTEHSYTQEQIAGDLGCTVSFVSNIENNRAKLNLRVLMYYARLCNVTIDSILNAGQNEDRQQDISEARDAEALNILHQFPPDRQEQIIRVLKYIKEMEAGNTSHDQKTER
ncbi:MAG: helix-turn-helix transcriptional regulator [Ruminococcus sp.]|jgi:transcriptional regulator with XRE-family HTH domain|uniref:XRE family transcriptional regulator n=1 Tax=Schaedlerella arabinosiphila TaxID=2044587 RepID=A0A426DDH3_9FIRM|nr:helix-turn-helix transcriptional regulator [Schaedlerella arabinosiphila]MCI8723836.1 helix-turn-helix transcriptional regulator [Ruminococcus sp.]MCI9212753.1 helix-turn-helix transcriptional regulator [Ruminococcus sp.]MDE7066194.1 helix-turn-helix domain-containing protein [Schaedlerella arabinosiphila]RRK30782.1 XRE family transcriptional regulator [Schaedlerella arabinosiphila]